MKIPKNERQRTDPSREGDGGPAAEPFETDVHEMTRTTQTARGQKRIRRTPSLQESEKRLGKRNDRAHDHERELEAGGKKFVRIPAKDKEVRSRETIKTE